jgi:predicted neuraminidase
MMSPDFCIDDSKSQSNSPSADRHGRPLAAAARWWSDGSSSGEPPGSVSSPRRYLAACWTAATILASMMFPSTGWADDADRKPVGVTYEWVYEQAPFPECHASTLVETPKGVLVAFFGGTEEKDPDVGVWLCRRTGPGQWSTPRQVVDGVQYRQPDGTVHRYPCWNPVLFRHPNGLLQLYFKVGPSPSTWWGELTESTDEGDTWSTPRRLPEGIAGPIKNKPLLLNDGRLLCPSSSEDHEWRVHFEWTNDVGRTWFRTPAIHDGVAIPAIQPAVLVHADGRLQALGRTKSQKIFSTVSTDQGETWSPMTLLSLPNPNSGIDAVTMADGRHVLIYNHTSRGRSPLNVAVSDDGIQWSAVAVLESQPGEYSYPAIIAGHDGRILLTYTYKRHRIRYVELDPKTWQPRPIVDGVWPKSDQDR